MEAWRLGEARRGPEWSRWSTEVKLFSPLVLYGSSELIIRHGRMLNVEARQGQEHQALLCQRPVLEDHRCGLQAGPLQEEIHHPINLGLLASTKQTNICYSMFSSLSSSL